MDGGWIEFACDAIRFDVRESKMKIMISELRCGVRSALSLPKKFQIPVFLSEFAIEFAARFFRSALETLL